MELRVVKYFLAVVDAGSITDGARRVYVTQPNVSRQLRLLERELGVDLFERGRGPVRLTHAGRRFEVAARDLVQRERLARQVTGLDDPSALRLTAVASFTTITRILAPFTAVYGGEHPFFDALEETPSRIFGRVSEAEADLGISTTLPPPGWRSRPLYEAGLTIQVPPSHPLHGCETVDVGELADLPLILIDRTNAARVAFDEALLTAGATTASASELNSPHMAQAHAAAGRGGAVVTSSAAFGLHPVRLMLGPTQVRVKLTAGWDAGHYATEVIERWLDDFCSWLPSVAGLTPLDL